MIGLGLRLSGLAAGFLLLSLIIVAMGSASLMLSAALVPGLVIGAAIACQPFAGLVLLVVFAQLDAVANIVSQALPISLYKLLTLAVLGGFGLMAVAGPRPLRLGERSREMQVTVLFALAMALSFLLCEYKGAAMGRLIGFYSVILLFFLISVLVDSPRRLEVLVWALVLTGLVSSVLVLLDTFLGVRLVSTSAAAATAQFNGQARSAGGSDYNPTTAAHMLMATTIIAGVLLVRHPRWRALSGLAFALGVPALVFTFARSAAIAFAVVALVFVWRQRRHRLFPFLLILGLIALGAGLFFMPPLFWARMLTLLDFGLDRTLLRRVSYNIIGFELWVQHPVLGIGPGNFPQYYAGPDFRWFPGREPMPRQLHNTYMELLTETGLVGLGLFLGVMLACLRKAAQVARRGAGPVAPLAEALAYAFAGFLLASVFMPNEDTKFMWLLPGLCLAAWRLARPETEGG